jgi:16S rRNA (guanine527-N7)-methyltransferase
MSGAGPPEAGAVPDGFWARVGWTEARAAALGVYRAKLEAANREVNLVGASTLGNFWTRHVLDSAQLIWFAPEATTWVDLGSGAGLPGVVLSILLSGRAGARVELVESMAKRCRFLEEVVGELRLPARVWNGRAENLRLSAQIVTARACAPMDRLLDYAAPHLRGTAQGLFLKGGAVAGELAAARAHWRFTAKCETSLSDPRGRVVWIRNLSRAAKR